MTRRRLRRERIRDSKGRRAYRHMTSMVRRMYKVQHPERVLVSLDVMLNGTERYVWQARLLMGGL